MYNLRLQVCHPHYLDHFYCSTDGVQIMQHCVEVQLFNIT